MGVREAENTDLELVMNGSTVHKLMNEDEK